MLLLLQFTACRFSGSAERTYLSRPVPCSEFLTRRKWVLTFHSDESAGVGLHYYTRTLRSFPTADHLRNEAVREHDPDVREDEEIHFCVRKYRNMDSLEGRKYEAASTYMVFGLLKSNLGEFDPFLRFVVQVRKPLSHSLWFQSNPSVLRIGSILNWSDCTKRRHQHAHLSVLLPWTGPSRSTAETAGATPKNHS